MDIKEMREKLADVVVSVPRKNNDVVSLFNEKFPDEAVDFASESTEPETVAEAPQKVEDNVYTYVGKGHEPPQVIKFMGIQAFKRGEPTKVTDPRILAKIETHACFIKGDVNADQLIRQDAVEKELYDKKVNQDKITQMAATRNNR